MKLTWMGEERELIEALFHWGNQYVALHKKQIPFLSEAALTPAEIQVIEYLLENEELQLNMAGVAKRLGISASSFTQLVAKLEKKGLLEKYYRESNRKDMIVCVSEKGKAVYAEYSERLFELWRDTVLEPLASIPPEHKETFARTLGMIFAKPESPTVEELIPVKRGKE